VDRIEKQLRDKASVVRVNVAAASGLEVARRYGVRATPTLLVLNGQGAVVYSHVGVPNSAEVVAAVEELR